jgi:hypothetical protein
MIKRRLINTEPCAVAPRQSHSDRLRLQPQPGATALGSVVNDVLNSHGQPLDRTTSSYMGSRFGHDFSKVRVHADSRAAEAAEAVNSYAFTFGTDIVFGSGQYSPQTNAGQQLLAHELTHVVQQQSGAAPLSIQRMAKWQPGTVSQELNLAERVASGTMHAGETLFVLNGTPLLPTTNAATVTALNEPTFKTAPSASGKGVDCSFDTLPTNEGTYDTKVIDNGPWQAPITRARLAALFPLLTPCTKAGAGNASLTLADNPDVTKNTRTHEEKHAIAYNEIFRNTVVQWDDKLTQAHNNNLQETGVAPPVCKTRLYGASTKQPPFALIGSIINDINAEAQKFHQSPAGRNVNLFDVESDPACTAVKAKVR